MLSYKNIRLFPVLLAMVFAFGLSGCNGGGDEVPKEILTAEVKNPAITYDSPGWFVEIKTTGKWTLTVTYPEGATTGWCTVLKSSGEGNSTATIGATVNTGEEKREVTARIKVGDKEVSVNLTQLPYKETGDGEDPGTGGDNPGESSGGGQPGNVPTSGRYELPKVEDPNWFLEYPTGDFAIEYNPSQKHSKWVAWPLNKSHQGSAGRNERWQFDTRIPAENRPLRIDFTSVSLSRGHLCPSNDRQANKAQNEATFFYSNMTPQVQNGFNGGIWLDLENRERTWVNTGKLYICAGGLLYNGKGKYTESELVIKYTEPSKMPVPKYNFKVVLREKTDGTFDAIGFWFENKAYTGNISANKIAVVRTVREIEQLSGIDFFYNLPKNIQDKVETAFRPQDWDIN